jgi:S1/P1 Nuclease
MKTPFALLITGLLSLLAPRLALAWGTFGHMEVAAAAYDQLTQPTRKNVNKLLKLNPQYSDWVKGVAPKDQPRVAFVKAATWPDWIKTQQSLGYTADGSANGDRPPSSAEASQNIGYADKNMHKYWHFYDTPYSPDGSPTQPPPAVNAKTEIALLSKALKAGGTLPEVKSYDLVWLEHLVGDVHQPLHCITRFDQGDPATGDAGGNLVKLCNKPKCRAELHGLWDDFPGSGSDPKSAIRKASSLPTPDSDEAKVIDEAVWIGESFEEAQKAAYVEPIGDGDGPFEVDAAYRANGRKVSNARLSLAGARLARLLNDALK